MAEKQFLAEHIKPELTIECHVCVCMCGKEKRRMHSKYIQKLVAYAFRLWNIEKGSIANTIEEEGKKQNMGTKCE